MKLFKFLANILWLHDQYSDCKGDNYMGEIGMMLVWFCRIMIWLMIIAAVAGSLGAQILLGTYLFICVTFAIVDKSEKYNAYERGILEKRKKKELQKIEAKRLQYLELHKNDPPKAVTKRF